MSVPPRINSTSPSASSPTIPRLVENRNYTRFADVDFGNRLADARNLVHTRRPSLSLRPEHTTAVGSVASEVANSIRRAALIPPGAPKHGWEKGSYRSPFDYHIPGHTVGGRDTPPGRSNSHASFAGLSSSSPLHSITPLYTSTPLATPAYEMKPRPESDSLCRTVTPGPDARERLVLIAPLRMIRRAGVHFCEDDREKLYCFIDGYMADSLHTVVERDGILPNIVYKVSIPMTDAAWVSYNQLLATFGFANGVNDMLIAGSDNFDKYTYMIDDVSAEHEQGWKVLASSSERNLDMTRLSQELVQIWKNTWIENGSGYVGVAKDIVQ